MILPLEYDITYKINQDENQAKDENLNSQDKALTQAPSEESKIALTGIPYLDRKIKDKTLSAYDAYLANKYMGVNFAKLNIEAQVKGDLKHTNMTKLEDEINKTLKNLNYSEQVLRLSDLAGYRQGIMSWLDEKTGGAIPSVFFGNERGQLQAAGRQMAYAAADAMNSGKATNESRKEAREIFGLGSRNKNQIASKVAQAMNPQVEYLNSLMSQYKTLGGKDELKFQKANEANRMAEFLTNTLPNQYGGEFNYQAYYNFKYGKQAQQNKTFQRLKK